MLENNLIVLKWNKFDLIAVLLFYLLKNLFYRIVGVLYQPTILYIAAGQMKRKMDFQFSQEFWKEKLWLNRKKCLSNIHYPKVIWIKVNN